MVYCCHRRLWFRPALLASFDWPGMSTATSSSDLHFWDLSTSHLPVIRRSAYPVSPIRYGRHYFLALLTGWISDWLLDRVLFRGHCEAIRPDPRPWIGWLAAFSSCCRWTSVPFSPGSRFRYRCYHLASKNSLPDCSFLRHRFECSSGYSCDSPCSTKCRSWQFHL